MDNQKQTKNQHFVPKTYLENFSIKKDGKADKSFINRMSKAEIELKGIIELPTQVVCISNDVYTLAGNTPEEKMLIEYFYRDSYENNYKKMYKMLIDNEKTQITEEERNSIILTVVSMLFRTQKIPQMHSELIKRSLENVFYMCKQVGKDFFTMDNEKIELKGRTLEQLQKDYLNDSKSSIAIIQLKAALTLFNRRMNTDLISIYEIKNYEYISSDNPVIHHNPFVNSNAPFDPHNILSLPLDSKHLLVLTPAKEPDLHHTIFRQIKSGDLAYNSKLVNNYQQMLHCNSYLLGTRLGLEEYLNDKKTTETPILDK